MSAPKDLAYRIIALQQPNGRPTTAYCWPTPEQVAAAIERDRQHDAAEIRPLIEAEHAVLLSQVARLRTALKRCERVVTWCKESGMEGSQITRAQNEARALLAETEGTP